MTLYSSPSPTGPPPLDQPCYGISLAPAVGRAFRKYAVFSGRASRSEYWWWVLGVSVVEIVLGGLALGIGLATSSDRGKTPGAGAWPFLILLVVFGLAVIVPSIALSVRRLHDSGNSGWLYLLSLIPYLGTIVVIIFGVLGTSPAGLKFESDPATAVLPPGMRPDGYQAPYAAPPASGYAYPGTTPAPYAAGPPVAPVAPAVPGPQDQTWAPPEPGNGPGDGR